MTASTAVKCGQRQTVLPEGSKYRSFAPNSRQGELVESAVDASRLSQSKAFSKFSDIKTVVSPFSRVRN